MSSYPHHRRKVKEGSSAPVLTHFRAARKRKDDFFTEQLDDAWRRFAKGGDGPDQVKSALDLFVQREVQMAKKEGRQPQYDTPTIRDELFLLLLAGYVLNISDVVARARSASCGCASSPRLFLVATEHCLR